MNYVAYSLTRAMNSISNVDGWNVSTPAFLVYQFRRKKTKEDRLTSLDELRLYVDDLFVI